jgi:3-phosphoshikimate 1-carboxyvinyltransferase
MVSLDIAAATIAPYADLHIPAVNMNPARSGWLRYAILMGARIHILDQRWEGDEPVSHLHIQQAKKLLAVEVRAEHTNTLIHDLPALAMLAVCASGTTVVCGLEGFPLDALLACLKQAGVEASYQSAKLSIIGQERAGLPAAKAILARFKEYSS